jgi:hypothetical protein
MKVAACSARLVPARELAPTFVQMMSVQMTPGPMKSAPASFALIATASTEFDLAKPDPPRFDLPNFGLTNSVPMNPEAANSGLKRGLKSQL